LPLKDTVAAIICPLFLLPPSAIKFIDFRAIHPNALVDITTLSRLGWRFRVENPSASIDDFIAAHQFFFLMPLDFTD